MLAFLGIGELAQRIRLDKVELHIARMPDGELNLMTIVKDKTRRAGQVKLPRTIIAGFRARFRDLAAEGTAPETVFPEIDLSFDHFIKFT